MQPKQSCGLRYPQQKLSNGPKGYIYITKKIEPSELRKHKRESKSYLGQKLISSSFAPLFLLSKPPPLPTLCITSNLAAPISLIPGVVRRVNIKKKHPLGGGLQWYYFIVVPIEASI